MINKNSFVKIMNGLAAYWEGLGKFEEALGIQIDQNFMTDIFDCVMDALSEDTEGVTDDEIGPLLYYYAFECNWGIGLNARKGVINPDGIGHTPLTSAEELYDYLQEAKKKNG